MTTIPITPPSWQMLLPPRPLQSHKGDFGVVGIIGGAAGMVGAPLLAARAALALGAGRVYAGLLDARVAVDPTAPELMLTNPEHLFRLQAPGCLVIGPGLGQDARALGLLRTALKTPLSLLIDADALNLVAAHPVLLRHITQRSAPTLLAPHPGEAARLLACSIADIQQDRAAAVRQLHAKIPVICILKGAGTLICMDETVWHNPTGNPAMAAPGMGDSLAGMIAALIAQGVPALAAAQAGVYLHGQAGDTCVQNGLGPRGLTASEVIACARSLLNEVKLG
jgi:ADP-dependent NAD(P)H-hydrate dehydratase / NAD(P)H-hydrate epimerase